MLPYLLWHKLSPTQKAMTENPKYANDRIAFVEGIAQRIENDYADMMSNQSALKTYAAALEILRTGKIGNKTLTEPEIKNALRTAITRIGSIDKQWAIPLASQLASEYNTRAMYQK